EQRRVQGEVDGEQGARKIGLEQPDEHAVDREHDAAPVLVRDHAEEPPGSHGLEPEDHDLGTVEGGLEADRVRVPRPRRWSGVGLDRIRDPALVLDHPGQLVQVLHVAVGEDVVGHAGLRSATMPARAARSSLATVVSGSRGTTTMSSGSLWRASRVAAWSRRSCSEGAVAGSRATTTATPISPMTSSGRGATATAATAGWSDSAASTS